MDGETRKIQRKNERRRNKCQHILTKEAGVVCSEVATEHIAICNAGLVNGLSQEIIAENFITYGPIEQITMLPGKSCCFVTFKNTESAENAYKNAHGKLNLAQDNKPLYLLYVESVPQVNGGLASLANQPPAGLVVLENFISVDEENLLLALNDFSSDSDAMKHRKVKHYGYEFRYDINNVDKDKPLEENIPSECNFLWGRLVKTAFADFIPDQLTINHYSPGQGIPPHVDTHSAFEDPIISLSLGDSVVMEFKNAKNDHKSVFLPQRSLLIMSGESRYNWTHGITPRKLDLIPTESGLSVRKRGTRTSFTFRKVRKGECDCGFLEMCDSYERRKEKSGIIDSVLAVKLEDQHVHAVYENVAGHFSETRSKPWPNVLQFVQSLEVGAVLVDVGCGNGKYLGENHKIFGIGCDRSANLLSICKTREFEVFACDCLSVPLKNDSVDAVISIAVIHHLANEERRLNAIKEMVRILRNQGQALIYVWAKDQAKDNEKSSYLKQDRRNRKAEGECISSGAKSEVLLDEKLNLPVHTNRKQFQHQDVLVPWKLKGEKNEENGTFLRYYHVFEEDELETLCKRVEGVQVCKSYYDQGNWCVLIKKVVD